MKTITEFTGFQLAKALATLEAFTVGGKTDEEKSAHIAQEYKLEGDKLKLFMQALEAAKGHTQHLKRVVVLTLNEGEKPPENVVEKEGRYFLTEFFYVPQTKKPRYGRGGRDARGERDKRGGRGGRKSGRDGGSRESRDGRRDISAGRRGERNERPMVTQIVVKPGDPNQAQKIISFGDAGKDKKPRIRPPHRRPPRAPKVAPPPNPLKIMVTPKGVELAMGSSSKKSEAVAVPTETQTTNQSTSTSETPKNPS